MEIKKHVIRRCQYRLLPVARFLSRDGVTSRDRLLDGNRQIGASYDARVSKNLTAWHVKTHFCDSSGQPKVLQASGPSGSLSSLLSRYAVDLPHRAIRKELQQCALTDEMNYWFSADEVDTRSETHSSAVRLGVGVYPIYDESQEGLAV